MTNRVGRPAERLDVRARLLLNARTLFANHGYSKVTTRMIAISADTDAAMIRYYFKNKENLFRTVIKETVQPLVDKINESRTSTSVSPEQFIETYYSLFSEVPELPKLIFRSIHDPDAVEHHVVSSVFRELMEHKASQLIRSINKTEEIDSNFDPVLVLISTVSLSVFPFLLPDDLKQELGVKLDKGFLKTLAKHHEKLLKNGIYNS